MFRVPKTIYIHAGKLSAERCRTSYFRFRVVSSIALCKQATHNVLMLGPVIVMILMKNVNEFIRSDRWEHMPAKRRH